MSELIITEYGEPSAYIAWKSELLKAIPAPEHEVGDIVIVPPGKYGIVQFYCSEQANDPPQDWIYAVCCPEDWKRIHYFPATSVIKRGKMNPNYHRPST